MFVKIAGADDSFSRLIDRLEKIASGVVELKEDEAERVAKMAGVEMLKAASLAPIIRWRVYPLHVTPGIVERSQ